MEKIALITGATAGIGEATAKKFAETGYDLIITGRRKERLEQLKKDLERNSNVKVWALCFDVRDKEAVTKMLNSLPDPWKNIGVLVNNAGLAVGKDPIQEGKIDDWERMIDTNIKGLLYITRTVTPWMVERKKGHIINVASIAGKEVYPAGNVYCATKHAVDALSRAIRLDLVEHGIKVTNIAPGLVETEFSVVRFKGDQDQADKVYEGYKPLLAEDIADVIWFTASRPAHVNIADVLITATAQANSTVVVKND